MALYINEIMYVLAGNVGNVCRALTVKGAFSSVDFQGFSQMPMDKMRVSLFVCWCIYHGSQCFFAKIDVKKSLN